jgi:cell fate (sporulation/competence/biofilm development) regulator YlbF (YheA/YmcA/DUF963 family)
MSQVLDKAQELAEAISTCEELNTLRLAAERVDTDEAATFALKRFQEKQQVLQRAAESGLELPQEQISEIQSLQEEIRDIPTIREFALAQSQFNALIDRVNDIIASAVMGVNP